MDLLMPLINAVALDEVHSPSPATVAVASPVPSSAGNTPAGKPPKATSPRKKKNRSHQKRKAKKATKPAASEVTVPEPVQESVPTVPVAVEPPPVVTETSTEQENRSPRKKRRQSGKAKNSKSNTPSTGKSPKNSLPVREPSSAPVSLPLAPNPNLINVRSPAPSLPTSPIARYASARGLASTRQSRNTASSASSFVSSQLLPIPRRPRLVPSALFPQSAGQLNQNQNRRHNGSGHGYYEGPRHFHPKPGTSNEYVSLEIADYYTRNRQSGEQFQQKQIIREIVEKQLRDKYPNHVISTYMIGSSWNGIGDNATCVDICILASKRNSVTPKTTVGAHEMASLDDAGATDSLEAMDFVVVGEETQEKKTVLSEAKCSTDENMDVDHSGTSGTPSDDQDLTLTDVQTVLQAHPNYVSNLVHIPAKVPILKFTDRFSSLSVTLNLNQDASVRNSQLIRDYAKLDWRLPYLAFVIKQWARENRVCSAIEHTISPYSWTLMVLHYLQVGAQPPVLPCLQKLDPLRYGAGDAGNLFGRHRYLPKWTSPNGANLRQLLKGFFRYYGYEFKASEEVISVREGARLDRATYQASLGPGREWKTACLCIEEPFTRANTTRSVNDPIKWENILNRFRLSSQALRGVRTSLWSILADDLYFPINYGK